jgi:hypothetical protein
MKKWLLVFLLVVNIASAVTIADWPQFFVKSGKFNAKYVVGEEAPALDVVSATVISTSLAKFENVTTDVGTSTLDSEISNISMFNAIVVGSPCENKAAAQLMGNPEPCYKDLGGSVGYIKVFESNGRVQVLITGLDEKDRNAAAKYLANKDLSGVKTTEYLVSSNSGSVPAFFEQKMKAKNATKNVSTNITATVPVKVTNVTPPKEVVNVTPVPKKITPGPYEPLDGVPKIERGWWAGFWRWLKGLFT